jgi:hypothetical protein
MSGRYLTLWKYCLFFICFSTGAVSHAVVIDTELDKTQFRIGDAIKIGIHVDAKDEIRVLFPADFPELHQFTVLNRRIKAPEKTHDLIRYTMELTISIYETGEFEIPQLEIAWETADGSRETDLTAPVQISVQSILTDDQVDPRPVKPPMSIPARIRYILAVLSALLVFIILLLLLVYGIRKRIHKRRDTDAGMPERLPIPPDQEALDALEKLLKQQLLVKGEIKIFFVTLSEILKVYIGRRYAFNATEHTTGEIRADMRHLRIEPAIQSDVLQVLELADMVKFARYKPSDNICRQALADIKKIVEKTRETSDHEPGALQQGGAAA